MRVPERRLLGLLLQFVPSCNAGGGFVGGLLRFTRSIEHRRSLCNRLAHEAREASAIQAEFAKEIVKNGGLSPIAKCRGYGLIGEIAFIAPIALAVCRCVAV